MNFGERLIELIKNAGLKNAAIADEFDFRANSISEWKNNGKIPNSELVIKLAKKFGVTTDYLLTGEQVDSFLMPDETVLISNYRKLTNEHKMLLQNTAQALTGVAK